MPVTNNSAPSYIHTGRVGTVSGVFWGVGTCLINLVAWANYVPGPDGGAGMLHWRT